MNFFNTLCELSSYVFKIFSSKKRSAFKEVSGVKSFLKKLAAQDSKIKFLRYRFRWNYFPELHFVSQFPTHVDVETTNRCNLRCVICPHAFPTPEFIKSLGSMDVALAIRIIDECHKKGLASIKLNWRGEPLLWKKYLTYIIRYAKEKGIIDVMLNTNGLLLDEKLSLDIIKAELDQIIFSIDGNSPETYGEVRQGGDFNKLVDNIESFLKIRNSLKRFKPLVRVQMVKIDDNIHEVDSFIKRWSPLIDSITFQDYTSRSRDGKRAYLKQDQFEKISRKTCPQIWQRIVVTWDGKVVMCCRDWESENVLGKLDYSSGKDLEYFWKGEKLNNIRKLHLEGRADDVSACSKCTYKESFKWKKRKKVKQ